MTPKGSYRVIAGVAAIGAMLWTTVSTATELTLSSFSGLPGEQATVTLTVDDLPLDGDGLFTLDADLVFDEAVVSIEDVREGALAAGADFFIVPPNPIDSSPVLLSIISAYTTGPTGSAVPAPPGGGVLLEIDVMIAANASGGDYTLDLTLDDSRPALSDGDLVDGTITVAAGEPMQIPLLPIPAIAVLIVTVAALAERASRKRTVIPD